MFVRWAIWADIEEPERVQAVKNSHKLWTVMVKTTLTLAVSFSEVYKSLYNGYSVLSQMIDLVIFLSHDGLYAQMVSVLCEPVAGCIHMRSAFPHV